MKTKKLFTAASAVIAALLFTTCEMDHLKPKGEYGILPERFKVDIPNSLSNTNFKSTSFKGTEADTVNGNII